MNNRLNKITIPNNTKLRRGASAAMVVMCLLALLLGGPMKAQNAVQPKIEGPNGLMVGASNGSLFYRLAGCHMAAPGIDIDISFYYNSIIPKKDYGYGRGWNLGVQARYEEDSIGVTIIQGNGRSDHFDRFGSHYEPSSPGVFFDLAKTDSGYVLTTPQGTEYQFSDTTHCCVTRIVDRNSNRLEFSYDSGQLVRLSDNAGHSITFTWADGHLASFKPSHTQNGWQFSYDNNSRLRGATNPMGTTENYTYYDNHRLKSVTNAKGETTKISYNSLRAVSRIETVLTDMSIRYDWKNRLTTVVDQSKNDHSKQYSSYEWDEEGRVVRLHGNCCGRYTEYAYDGENNVVMTRDGNGSETHFTYDAKGNCLSITDALGHTQNYTYGPFANKTSYTDQLGRRYTYTYDPHGNLTALHGPLGYTVTISYNACGQPVAISGPLQGSVTRYTYDDMGNIASVTDPQGHTFAYTHNAYGSPTSVTNPLSGTTHYRYNDIDSLVAVVSPMGVTTSYQYDELGRISARKTGSAPWDAATYDAEGNLRSYQDPAGHTSTYSYNQQGSPLSVTDPMGNTSLLQYDRDNNLEMSVSPTGDTTRYLYDNKGNRCTTIYPSGREVWVMYDSLDRKTEVRDQLGVTERRTYDAAGNLTRKTDGAGTTETYAYDDLNRIISRNINGRTDSYTYDMAGNMLTHTDPMGRTYACTYDLLGNITSATDPMGHTTTYTYNALGRLASVTDAKGQTTDYGYSPDGTLTRITFPNGKSRQYVYNDRGLLAREKDEDGRWTDYAYYDDDRIMSRSCGNESEQFLYDADGLVVSAANGNATTTYTYDEAGRMLTESCGTDNTVYHSYDRRANTHTLTYPSGSVVVEHYDLRGRLAAIVENGIGQAAYTYNLKNQPATAVYARHEAARCHYNTYGRMDSLSSGILGLTYLYDEADNLTAVIDAQNPSQSERYLYDELGRLTGFRQGIINQDLDISNPIAENSYSYDALGSRTTHTDDAGTHTYATNSINGYTSVDGRTMQYDNCGNLVSDGLHTYQYNWNNLLVSVDGGATAAYTYDAFHRRISKTTPEGSTTYIYDGNKILEERDASNQLAASYIYGAMGADDVVRMRRGGEDYFFHADRMGSVMAVTDAAGDVVERYSYDPFGHPAIYNAMGAVSDRSAIGNSRLFTGREYDGETGLYHYRLRTMNPELGRFHQYDPLYYADCMNLYTYVGNRPTYYIDPTGALSEQARGDISAGLDMFGTAHDLGTGVLLNNMGNTINAGNMTLSETMGVFNEMSRIESASTAVGVVLAPVSIILATESAMDNYSSGNMTGYYLDCASAYTGMTGLFGAGLSSLTALGYGAAYATVGSALSAVAAVVGAGLGAYSAWSWVMENTSLGKNYLGRLYEIPFKIQDWWNSRGDKDSKPCN